MKPLLSVHICTYNPKPHYLERVLTALAAQTLSKDLWELLLIDNASDRILSTEIDLSWHPQAAHLREEKLGKTNALLLGIERSQGEILVTVDDDNVLEPNYLEIALKIGQDFPLLGAWGGQNFPEFEQTPPEWTKPYWGMLAIREFSQDKWSNYCDQMQTTPVGAGMCFRKVVGEKYAQSLSTESERLKLGRTGNKLNSGEDSDLAFTAYDLGLGTGVFTALQMLHIMPPSRLELDYLERLAEGLAYSEIILASFRGQLPAQQSWQQQIYKYYTRWRQAPSHPLQRRIYNAWLKGLDQAVKELQPK